MDATGPRRSTASSCSTPTPAGGCGRSRPAARRRRGPRGDGCCRRSLDYPFRPAESDRRACCGRAAWSTQWDALAAPPAGRRDRRRRRAREARSAQRRSRRQPVRAAAAGLRGVVPGAVDSRQAGRAAVRRRGGRCARADARDSRRASLHRGRRRRRRRRRSSSPRPTSTARCGEGDELGVGGPVTLRVRSNAPPEFTTIVWSGAIGAQRRPSRAGLHRRGAAPSRPSTGSRFARPAARTRSRDAGCGATRSTCGAPSRRRRLPPRAAGDGERADLRRHDRRVARRARSDVAGRGRTVRRSSAAPSCGFATGWPAARRSVRSRRSRSTRRAASPPTTA